MSAGLAVKAGLAICLAFALAGCETTPGDLDVETPQVPKPLTLPGGQAERVSGALKPGGGQPVKARGGRGTLRNAEIIEGAPRPAVLGSAAQVPAIRPGEPVGLNFVDADLGEVVDVIVAQFLGRNYIIDPAVSGQVTMRTTERIPRDQLLGVLEDILAMNGAALVTDGTLVRVVPAEAAPALSGVAGEVRPDVGRGEAVYLVPLKHASAESVQGVAQSVLGPGGKIVVDPKRNYLMFTGTTRDAQSVQDLVRALDVDLLAGRSFGLFPLDVAAAGEVSDELKVVLGIDGNGGPVQVMPIERMNAVLVVASDARDLRSVRSWVQRLDRAVSSTGSGAQIYVYHVRNGRASELAGVLGAVFGGEKASREPISKTGVAPTLKAVNMQSTGDGSETQAGGSEKPTLTPDTGPAQQVFTGNAESNIAGGEGPAVRFIADERNNAIVIVATPTQYELARATLDRLDIVPLQVLIEVTIAEVTLDNDLRYGLQWFFESRKFSGSLTNSTDLRPAATVPGFNVIFDSANARAVLSALSEVTNVKVISSPQLMVLDNQVARLHVGDQVPVSTAQLQTVDGGGDNLITSNTIERVDTGVILEVTPRVNSSGLVTMDIVQDVSDPVTTTTSNLDSPTIQQRNIQTTVAIQSGATVALGGLIRDRLEHSNSGVPVLKDIPVVGSLFGTKGRGGRRTELLVLITPNVLRDTHEARLITEELHNRLVGLRELDTGTD